MSALSRVEARKQIALWQARTLKVGLFLDASTEVSGLGYARQNITLSNPIERENGVRTANTNVITFGPAGEDWAAPPSKITWIKIFDQADSGIVWAGALAAAVQMSVLNNHPYEFKAGYLGILIQTYD